MEKMTDGWMLEINVNWLNLERAAGPGPKIAIGLGAPGVRVTLFGSQAKSAAVVVHEESLAS